MRRSAPPRPAALALRFVEVWVGVPMVGRGSSETVFPEVPFAVADRRVVPVVVEAYDLLFAVAGRLGVLLDPEALPVVGIGVTDGRPGWLRIC